MTTGDCSATVLVDLDEIDPHPASEVRAKFNQEAVEDYAGRKTDAPPVRLVYDREAGIHWLADGYHRYLAAKRKKAKRLWARIVNGSSLDAFLLACKANIDNGVYVTNADKRQRVEAALKRPEMQGWSNRRIAEACGVSPGFVDRLRPDMELPIVGSSTDPDAPTVGRDGKARRKPRKPDPKPEENTTQPDSPAAAPPAADEPEQHPTSQPPADPPRREGDGWEDNDELKPGPAREPLPGQEEIPFVDGPEPAAGANPGGIGTWPNSADDGPGPAVDDADDPVGGFDFDAEWRRVEASVRREYERFPGESRGAFAMRLGSLARRLEAMSGQVTNLLEQGV